MLKIDMVNQDYIAYALAAMVLFSMGNIALKMLTQERSLGNIKSETLFGAGLIAVLALGLMYILFFRNIPGSTLALLLGAGALGLVGFMLFMRALQHGSSAIVTAIVSLSTVLVAIISIVLFGEQFSAKQFAAIGLAVLSLLLLAF